MLHAMLELLLYGLLAGLSPLAVVATVAVMQAGRLKALAFGIGFFLGQALTCSAFVIIGVAASGASKSNHPGLHAVLDVLLALAALVLAAGIRKRPPKPRERSSERTRAALDRLGRVRLFTAMLAGLLLGIGGPKRLVLTALAATVISTTGVSDASEAALVVWYVAIATVLVWVPVVSFVVFGDRMIGVMKRAQEGAARRQPTVTVYALVALAVMLVVDAITFL
jgi:hypothetical protein